MTIRRRILLFSIVGGLLLSPVSASGLLASARSKTRDGNRLYEEKKYDEALKRYTEAQLEAPDSPQLHYNLGNVLFRKGEIKKARDEYRRALASADPGLDPRAIYNLGNTFFTRQEYKDAVGAYQRALRLDPSDPDAKRNLELALLRMKQQQQPQQQPSGGDREDGEKQEQQEDKQTPRGGEEKNQEAAEKKESRESDRREKGGLSREEAERILNALQEDEKENMKKRMAAAKEEREEVEKDW